MAPSNTSSSRSRGRISKTSCGALGCDHVSIGGDAPTVANADAAFIAVSEIRDAEGVLGRLVVDNRASRRAIDRGERELLEMLAEYLAIALRNSRLYGQIAETKR